MAGVKGRSGRKSWDKELESKHLWELALPILKHALKSDKIDQKRKQDIALEVFKRLAPKDLTVKGEGLQTIVHNIIRYGGDIEKATEKLPISSRLDQKLT